MLLTGAIVVALTVGRSDTNSELEVTQAEHRVHRPPERSPGEKACHRGTQGHTLPAKILGENASLISTEILVPVNTWVVGDCDQVTWVYAGVSGHRAREGIFVIERESGQHRRDVYILLPDAGPVRITDAPRGPNVITSAQQHGKLQFTSRRGVSGELDLATDAVTLSSGEVIQATGDPFAAPG